MSHQSIIDAATPAESPIYRSGCARPDGGWIDLDNERTGLP